MWPQGSWEPQVDNCWPGGLELQAQHLDMGQRGLSLPIELNTAQALVCQILSVMPKRCVEKSWETEGQHRRKKWIRTLWGLRNIRKWTWIKSTTSGEDCRGRERCVLSMFSREQTALRDLGEQWMTLYKRFRCIDVQLGSFCFSLSTWPDFDNSKALKVYYRYVSLLPTTWKCKRREGNG